MAVLTNPANPSHAASVKEMQRAAPALRLQLQLVEVRDPNELDGAFAAMTRERAGAAIVVPDGMFASQRKRVVYLAARSRLPAMYEFRDDVEAGGLMSYGSNFNDLARRAAIFVDKILKGAKPRTCPSNGRRSLSW